MSAVHLRVYKYFSISEMAGCCSSREVRKVRELHVFLPRDRDSVARQFGHYIPTARDALQILL